MTLWTGEFGDAYTARNRVDWRKRIPFWTGIMDQTGARSVHEVGCNAGWNLSAIRRAFPDASVSGNDVNEGAVGQAIKAGLSARVGAGLSEWIPSPIAGNWGYITGVKSSYDLVFTSGVLIHVPPAELRKTMEAIVNASSDYVLAVEYAAVEEEEVLYRGQKEALWKRPFGEIYEQMGLRLISCEFLQPEQGFDFCTAWLMRKVWK